MIELGNSHGQISLAEVFIFESFSLACLNFLGPSKGHKYYFLPKIRENRI